MKEVRRRHNRHVRDRKDAISRASRENWRPDTGVGKVREQARELMAIRDGRVLVYQTENLNAGISTAADRVRNQSPYGINGSNNVVGVWDAAHARTTHVELAGRVTANDGTSLHYHSTHVCGTVAAAGVVPGAIGMAPGASVESYDWNADMAEMTDRAMADLSETDGIQLSNHSYGHISGWDYGSWPVRWYGTWGQGYRESEYFGAYTEETADWDALCYDAPYFLPVKSAGNDRTDAAPSAGQAFEYYSSGWMEKEYDPAEDPLSDNWEAGGFDTIPDIGNAKNILTVGAVDDAVESGNRSLSKAQMESYSGWGPADDGRVKPDVVANGNNLYSTDADSDTDYLTLSGTSMSTPNAAGSAVLLAAYHRSLFSGIPILSSTLKGLIIHTADDLGLPGPDYSHGWGLMNTLAAAEHLRFHHDNADVGCVREDSLSVTNAANTFTMVWNATDPLKITLCWTDPPGEGQSGLDNRTPALVNDLDLRVIGASGVTNFPYVLSATNPAARAATGDNMVDNIEQVFIPNPEENTPYTVVVSHKGILGNGIQHYSLLADGIGTPAEILHTPLENTTNTNDPYAVEATIATISPLDPDSLWMFWSSDPPGPGSPGSNRLANVGGDLYRATIPAHPLHTRITYFLRAATSNGLVTVHPPDAPVQAHSFHVAPEVRLSVFGAPDENGPVVPDYGSHLHASGNTVRASAALTHPDAEGHRYACIGWVGVGDVPASGTSNSASFSIGRDSVLIWKWASQYRLAQTSSVPGIVDTTTWWEEHSSGWTETAPSVAYVGVTPYRFAEWHVDGARYPDPTAVAVNPAGAFAMSAARTATAVYLPETLDDDADGLADWWERYYFGSLIPAPDDDSDGDGYLNLEEYQDRSNPVDAASFPAGPTIVHTPLPDPLTNPAPWTIETTVTDNYAVDNVILRWKRNGLNWRQTAMSREGETDLYTATMPPPGSLGDAFEYVIEATDAAGYYVEDGIYRSFVAYPLLIVTPDNVNAVLLEGTVTNTHFTIQNAGNTDLVWTVAARDVGAENDVERGTNGWTHYGQRDLWHITTNRSFSSSHSWYCGYDDTGRYDDSMEASLVTPPVLLGGNPVLRFMHWCSTELDTGDYTWDGAVVEVSTNGGVSYEFLTPEGGYPYLIVDNPASPFDPHTPCFGGNGGWEEVAFDLSDYAGMEALIRFRFGSDGYVVDEGWYLDDMRITPATGTNEWLTILETGGSIRAHAASNITLRFDCSNLHAGTDDAVMLKVRGNDPIDPADDLLVSVEVRGRPRLGVDFAGQTSRNGSGLVTVSNTVYDGDGDLCSMELMFSTDSGQSWNPSWVGPAEASLGSLFVNNSIARQILGIVTADAGAAATNSLTITWQTTNGPYSLVQAPDAMVRSRVWDGSFWSHPVTSFPFMVDNEAPSDPAFLAVSSHLSGPWSTNDTFEFNWGTSSDGSGIGLAGYGYAVTNSPDAPPHMAGFTPDQTATTNAPFDGTNLWVLVRGIDAYGNSGSPLRAGPFRVDSTPPSPQGASIVFSVNPNGNYVVDTDVSCTWSGFTDGGSGIAGYYFGLADGAPSTNGQWTLLQAATVTGAIPDRTNTVHVWARDHVGLIGASAASPILVLRSDTDWDRDGLSTGQENLCGTDAANPENVLRLHQELARTPPDTWLHTITWQGVSNRLYTLHESADLVGDIWQPIPSCTDIPGTNGTITCTRLLTAYGHRFYRVTVTTE